MPKYLKHFPKPLLKDLVVGRWLPIVGAGFSRNAKVPDARKVPLWDELGNELAEELDDYAPNNAVDAISAFEHEYGRPKLIERLKETLLVSESRPGQAHAAFCSVPFDLVCTTNFDFLLEKQYEITGRQCTPIIDEDQLSVNFNDSGTSLLKLHGDLHHPHRLVATESDYDSFLDRFPLIATFLSSLLITRVAVFIGYSLDDPDFRQVWQVVRERLGKSRLVAYAIIVSPKQTDISRFERRGVKVISLPGKKEDYGSIFFELFNELKEYWTENVISKSQVKQERPLNELALAKYSATRLCFFSIPTSMQAFYREHVFPIAEREGFVPITADDVLSPGDNWLAKVDAILKKSKLFVADISSTNTMFEAESAIRRKSKEEILIISPDRGALPFDIGGLLTIFRPDIYARDSDTESLLNSISAWFNSASRRLKYDFQNEPQRLLDLKEYRSAVISAMSLLESTLKRKISLGGANFVDLDRRTFAMSNLLAASAKLEMIHKEEYELVRRWNSIRNEAVHSNKLINAREARTIVEGVYRIVEKLEDAFPDLTNHLTSSLSYPGQQSPL